MTGPNSAFEPTAASVPLAVPGLWPSAAAQRDRSPDAVGEVMARNARYVHTNLEARDWQALASFYQRAFDHHRTARIAVGAGGHRRRLS